MRGEEGERIRGGALGLGLLVGGAVFSYAHQLGCTKAEILAINDDGARVEHLSHTEAHLDRYLRGWAVCFTGWK
jgi:hypothetical protein